MPAPCVSCRKSSSDPFNFLLPCIQCSDSWHHRCHAPPVLDSEVVEIIKLFNAKQKKGDPNARLVWKCNTCVKGKAKAIIPQLQSAGPPARPLGIKSTPQHLRPASSKPSGATESDAIVIEDDEDEIIILDKPSAPPAPVNRIRNELATSSLRSRNTPVHERNRQVTFAPQPPTASSREPKENNRNRVHGSSFSQDSAAFRQLEDVQIEPSVVPAKSSLQKEFIAKKPTTSVTPHDTGILIIDDPYVVSVVHSTDKQTATEGDDDDDPLEYLTPPQSSPAALPPPDPPRVSPPSEQSTLPTDAVSELTTRLVLLPAWISSRHTTPDAEPDLWERRRQVLGCSNAKQSPVTSTTYDSATEVEDAIAFPASSRRKFKTQYLRSRTGKDIGQAATQTPFFFSADAWMRHMLRT